jgi:hypothetical protein
MKKTLVLEAATEALEENQEKEKELVQVINPAIVKPKRKTKKVLVLEERTPQEPIVLEIAEQGLTNKKTNVKTKKKKVVDFDIVEE